MKNFLKFQVMFFVSVLTLSFFIACSNSASGSGGVPVTGVELNEPTLSLKPDESFTLVATVKPYDATNKSVTWTIDNEDIAAIDDNGKVTAKKDGTAIITVTTKDGNKTATCTLTVNSKAENPSGENNSSEGNTPENSSGENNSSENPPSNNKPSETPSDDNPAGGGTSKEVTVIFKRDDGTTISTKKGKTGESLVVPDVPIIDKKEFVSWQPEVPTTFPESDAVYTAVYKEIGIVLVIFDANGGTYSDGTNIKTFSGKAGDSVESAKTEEVMNLLSYPTREGYEFWGYEPNATLLETFPQEDTTYKAVWHEIPKVNFIFNANGGAFDDGASNCTLSYLPGATFAPPKNPTKEGYKFLGWNTSSYSSFTTELPEVAPSYSRIYYAVWKELVTICFDANGGSFSDGNSFCNVYGDVGDALIQPENPTKEGCRFIGWSTSSYSSYATTLPETFSSYGSTYYAVWGAATFTVKFASAGSYYDYYKGTMESITFDIDEEKALPKNTFTLNTTYFSESSYVFEGWATSKTGDVVFTDEQVIKDSELLKYVDSVGTVTLYAKAVTKYYTVYFDGASSSSSQKIEYGTPQKLYKNTDTREFYEFKGWSTDSNATTPDYEDEAEVLNLTNRGSAIYLYAVWELLPGYVELKFYGKKNYDDKQKILVVKSEEPFEVPILEVSGYRASVWEPALPSVAPSQNTTYTAIDWAPNPYKVCFSYNNNIVNIYQDFLYDLEQALLPNTFTKPGNVFIGWATYSGSNYVVYNDLETVKNLTDKYKHTVYLYPVWEPVNIEVTLPSQSDDISLTYKKTYNAITFTAGSGYTSYSWYFGKDVQSETSNEFVLNTSSLKKGVYTIMVTADNLYSATVTVTVE